MTPNTPLDPVIACAENIALLSLLHSVPTLPASNSIDGFQTPSEDYALSFGEERGLTSTLAFLSSISNNPNHIPAICIEENPNSAFLSVLLAVNKAKRNDGNQFLQTLKQGFESIFTILSHSSDGEPFMFPSLLLPLISLRRRWYSKYRERRFRCNRFYVLGSHPPPSTICYQQPEAAY
jgi:hypothetical protein